MLKWIGIYFGISLALSSVLRFPLSMIAFIGVFLVIQFARAYVRYRKSGGMKLRGLFNPSSSTFGLKPIKYYCMNCGTSHNQRDCPNCGSRMKRVG
jgi:hypothetical protein